MVVIPMSQLTVGVGCRLIGLLDANFDDSVLNLSRIAFCERLYAFFVYLCDIVDILNETGLYLSQNGQRSQEE